MTPEGLFRAAELLCEAANILSQMAAAGSSPAAEPTAPKRRGRPPKTMTDTPVAPVIDSRTIGGSGIPNVNHPDIAAEQERDDAELEARITMRRLREQGIIDTKASEPSHIEDIQGDDAEDDLVG